MDFNQFKDHFTSGDNFILSKDLVAGDFDIISSFKFKSSFQRYYFARIF